MKCCQPHWKSQGIVREFDLVWRVVTLQTSKVHLLMIVWCLMFSAWRESTTLKLAQVKIVFSDDGDGGDDDGGGGGSGSGSDGFQGHTTL